MIFQGSNDDLVAAIDALHEGAVDLHWQEAARLAEVLGWTDPFNPPDGTWMRAQLRDRLR